MSGVCANGSPGVDARNLVPGEFLLTERDFSEIAAMIHADAGIYLPQSKAALVYARLAKRLRALGLASFRDYCKLVAGSDGLDERQKMLAALTTNVTRFFREPHHFEHLQKKVLPPLVDLARRGGRLRIWSAACSSGEEPYSIALTVLSLMPDAGNYDVKVLATDIDPDVIEKGKKGTYTLADLAAVPAPLRAQWFVALTRRAGSDPHKTAYSIAPEVKNLVTFRELNLFGTWPMKGNFQAIFCRNVAIYFQASAQEDLWSRFLPKLARGGVLYIGHSERITGTAADSFDGEGVTTYRLKGPHA